MSARYQTPKGVESEYQPGSGRRALANLQGIRSRRKMDLAETEELERVQIDYLQVITPDTQFDAALICQMHRDWLGGLYAWAGRYRKVELSKTGFSWPPAYLVERNMQSFETEVLRALTPCRPWPLEDVALAIARVHAELLLIHPFREGNGRLARWFADLMALQAGYPLPSYRFTGRGSRKERSRYLNAVKKGYLLEYAELTAFFSDALRAAGGRVT
jgi:cell filamentation protein